MTEQVLPAAASRPLSKWLVLALLAGSVYVSDQVTKFLAVQHLTVLNEAVNAKTFGERLSAFTRERDLLERGLSELTPVPVVPQVWQHRYTQNRGAAWGFLQGANDKFRVPFFYLISIAAVIFIGSYYRKLRDDQRYLQIALALVAGGAIGNATDRILHGYVIDFIDWHWFDPNWLRPALHWPTFNVADSGITVGLVMLFLEMLFVKRKA